MSAICPFCGGNVEHESWYDEEGIEAFRCADCDASTTGDWNEPLPAADEWDNPPSEGRAGDGR